LGGALRRLVYTAAEVTPAFIQAAQCLTEQVTQRALSVKAGEPPVSVADFEAQLTRLLQGKGPGDPSREGDDPEAAPSSLSALLALPWMRVVWQELQAQLGRDCGGWLAWVRNPHQLADLVARAGRLEIPWDDLRLRCWMS
jgi:hypothetical protein